jgi:hypothetical protein
VENETTAHSAQHKLPDGGTFQKKKERARHRRLSNFFPRATGKRSPSHHHHHHHQSTSSTHATKKREEFPFAAKHAHKKTLKNQNIPTATTRKTSIHPPQVSACVCMCAARACRSLCFFSLSNFFKKKNIQTTAAIAILTKFAPSSSFTIVLRGASVFSPQKRKWQTRNKNRVTQQQQQQQQQQQPRSQRHLQRKRQQPHSHSHRHLRRQQCRLAQA